MCVCASVYVCAWIRNAPVLTQIIVERILEDDDVGIEMLVQLLWLLWSLNKVCGILQFFLFLHLLLY